MVSKSPYPASIDHPDYDKRAVKRLLKYSKKVGNCIIWTGQINWNGYGYIRYKKKMQRVHRLSYLLMGKKSLTPGLVLDHLCRNRLCINSDHLEEVTNKENLHRGKGYGWINRKILKI